MTPPFLQRPLTDDERAQQAKVLAELAALPPGTTIEQWNKQRFTADILAREQQELRAAFIITEKQKTH